MIDTIDKDVLDGPDKGLNTTCLGQKMIKDISELEAKANAVLRSFCLVDIDCDFCKLYRDLEKK